VSDASGGRTKLVIHLMGGLGNQLFQYAFARNLALASEAVLEFDTSGYAGSRHDAGSPWARHCELQYFRTVGSFVGEPAVPIGHGFLSRAIRRGRRLLIQVSELGKPYYLRSVIVEPESQRFRFDARLLERQLTGTVEVRGFWQSEKYFQAIERTLRKELVLSGEHESGNAAIAERIGLSESVALHVRHGDNATDVAPNLGVLPPEYYRRCIDAIRRDVVRPEFFVFSDDIVWARQFLAGMERSVFVDRNDPDHSRADLMLMVLCRHHIIANSTFGWWGAWLGKKPGQIVYAPGRYYQNADRPNPDYYPEGWRLV
jgi:hypothetical protein